MNNQKVELLSPAGNFDCFRAALNAGADAVYLGGEKYGARAYAGNFTTEEIIKAICIAHIFKRKIYLTVNTLVKESEFKELIPYMTPLYEAGLDGVIVQDIGVLECLRNNFPNLALHASTQMTITGVYGAAYMKKLGVCRVVPARELSLDEIKDIKEKTGLEVECFIHGAMCYAYSGQCLFSSILGGRSGNRGRCAGPCRLPYTDVRNQICYPFSLKDMYTLSILPGLINTGIDSFKIEGRMKSPEYVAGVTAMYRKYIDGYIANPDKPYKVSQEDEQLIRSLYIRSDICPGYYYSHNDKSMVTLKEPGYSGSSQEVVQNIQEKYLLKNISLPITAYVRIYAGEQASLTFSCDSTSVTVTGETVNQAMNRPLDKEEISKRIGKLGDTCFELTDLTIDTDNISFMPVKSLNELRRMACVKLEEALCRRIKVSAAENNDNFNYRKIAEKGENGELTNRVNVLCVLTTTVEQLSVANSFTEIDKIYVDADIFMHRGAQVKNVSRADVRPARRVGEESFPTRLSDPLLSDKLLMHNKEYILVMPHIFRKRSYKYLAAYERLINSGRFSGVMIRNYEELEWIHGIGYTGCICSDYMVYAWNNATLEFLSGQLDEVTLPLELNRKELGQLSSTGCITMVLYGFIPLMYSANCIRNTLENCINKNPDADNMYHLTDRYKNVFTIKQNCIHCYNILYNTVPMSLHGQLGNILKRNYNVLRLDFSIENRSQTKAVIEHYLGNINNKGSINTEFPFKEYTNGHYKRGVE